MFIIKYFCFYQIKYFIVSFHLRCMLYIYIYIYIRFWVAFSVGCIISQNNGCTSQGNGCKVYFPSNYSYLVSYYRHRLDERDPIYIYIVMMA